MIKDTDFFANIPPVKPEDKKVEKSKRPEDIMVREKVDLLNEVLTNFEGEAQSDVIEFGSQGSKFNEAERKFILKKINTENKLIVQRENRNKDWEFEIFYIPIPPKLINCDEKSVCLTIEEIEKINELFLSSIWDKKMNLKKDVDPSDPEKKELILKEDSILDADIMLRSAMTMRMPQYISSGAFSDIFKSGSFSLGKAVAATGTEAVRDWPEKRETFAILDGAFLEGETMYGEHNPLVNNYLFQEIIRSGEYKIMNYVDNSKPLRGLLKRGRLPIQEILVVARDIARGVSLLHKKREFSDAEDHWVTHNDLHAGNILVVYDDQERVVNAKIVDYGTVLELDGNPSQDNLDLGDIMNRLWNMASSLDSPVLLIKDTYLKTMKELRQGTIDAEEARITIEKMLGQITETK